jgi:hypothetical protein
MNLLALAERLGLTIPEIEQMSLNEYNEWVAYYSITQERAENGK